MQIMTALAEGDRAWAIPWPCCYEFLSVSTNRRIWKDEVSTPTQAWRQFEAWASSPTNRMIGERMTSYRSFSGSSIAPGSSAGWFTMRGSPRSVSPTASTPC